MTKKLLVFWFLICFLLTGCVEIPDNKITVVTTIFPQYDIVRWIAKDKVELYLTVSPGIDTHSYDPSVEDIIRIKKCDLFIYMAGCLEQWAVDLKDDSTGLVLDLSSNENIILEEVEEKHEHHTNHDHVHDHDPHIWTSPTYLKYMAYDICNELVKLDPTNKEFYEKNRDSYVFEIDKIILEMNQLSIEAQDKTFYFGTPFAMHYFFKEFNLKYESIYETCATEIEPSIFDIIEMHETIIEDNVKNLYVKELISTGVAERIINGTLCELQLLHSGHNVSSIDFKKGITLIDIMNNNIIALRKELK